MRLFFSKYQGTGNDFILIDNRKSEIHLSNEQVALLCDRRFGIGADGLMLLELTEGYDFKMVYYNSDGNLSSMCGNGGRCISAFAKRLGLINEKASFVAVDGPHEVLFNSFGVSLKMNDVSSIENNADHFYLNTGSPHYVRFVNDVMNCDVFTEGKKIRNNERFKAQGTNVNFIEKRGDLLFVRTYERGVEDETFSCGTGVTAAALVAAVEGKSTTPENCLIKTKGGELNVRFKKLNGHHFTEIWLEGPATFVFDGRIEV